MTTDPSKVIVKTFYERKVFSVAVETQEGGFSPDKVIDAVEIYGLAAMPFTIRFNESILGGKYSARYRMNFDKRSVEISGLDLKITNQEMEKTEIFTLKLPTHFIG